jgi:adenosyl cobinamide kinase/adenosyl cobinamide phosphate guanylyltransferase
MSTYPSLYNGELPLIFNASDFNATQYIDSLQTNITTSNLIASSTVKVIDEDGNHKDVATQEELDNLRDLLLGTSQLNNSLETIRQISDAINDDPEFYTHITSSIQGVQDSITDLSDTVSTIQTNQTTDESNISDLQSDVSTIQSKQTTDETNISNLQTSVSNLNAKTSALNYNSSTNTTTVNSKVVVALDEFLNGNTTIGDSSSDTLVVNAATTFNSNVLGITKSMIGLNNVDNTSDVNKPVSTAQTSALSLKANLASPIFTGNVQGISKSMIGLNNVDNTSDANKPVSSATLTSLNLKANQTSLDTTNTNVTALQNKTNAMTFNSGTNTLTMNENIVVALDESLNGNVTIGNASTDVLTVNSATTFNGSITGLTKSMVSLNNVDNTSDANKPVSTAQQSAINLKSDDNAVVKLTGAQTVAGIKTFSSSPIVPTCSANDNSTKAASTAYCDTAISSLIASAPSALNTLNELATALGNDANYSTTITTALSGKAGLSSNNTFSGTNTFSGSIILNSEDLDSRLDTDETNIASNTTAITTLQTQITTKALDSATCHNTGAETWAGIKTFSSAPVLPSNSISNSMINNTSINSGYVDATSSIQTQLNAKSADSAVVHNTGTESIAGQKTFSTGITLNGTDLQTRLASDESTLSSHTSSISSINSSITTLNGKTSALSYDGPTDTLTVTSKLSISKDVSDNGSINLGDGVNSDVVNLRANISTNSQTITPTQLGYVSGATSNLQTQISSKAADSAVVKLTTDQTIAGIKTFSSAPILPSNSISNSMINNTAINSGYVDATSSIQTQLNAKSADSAVCHNTGNETWAGIKTFSSAPVLPSNSISNSMINNTSINSGYVDATSSIQTQINAKAADSLTCHLAGTETITGAKTLSGGITLSSNITANSCTITPTELSYIDGVTSNLQTQLDAKATDSLTCHLSGTETISGVKTFSANNVFSGTNNINMLNENINYVSSVTTSLSLDYTICKGINLIATPTSNYSLAITNVPTGSTNAVYTVTLLSTAKFYVNSITVNGTSRTIYASGGTSNISINGSASYVMQQLNISYLNSSTPVVFSSVISIW